MNDHGVLLCQRCGRCPVLKPSVIAILVAIASRTDLVSQVHAQDYNGGQILNQNQTYSGTVNVTAADKVTSGAVAVSNSSVITNLNGNVTIRSYDSNSVNTGNTFDYGVAASAGVVNLTGDISITTDSIAGSGVFANGGRVSLTASPDGTPINVSIIRSSGAGTPPSEASAIYALGGGVVNITGNLIASAAQVRGYGLWSSSTSATGILVTGNAQLTTTGNQGFGIRQDSAGTTQITGNTVIDSRGGLAAAGMRVVNGGLSFGGDLSVSTVSSSDQVGTSTSRYESGYGVWNTAASGVVGPGGTITVGGTTKITTTGSAAFGVFNDAPSGLINFNGPVFIDTSGGTANYSYTPKGATNYESVGAYGVESNDGTTNFNGPATITTQGSGSTGGGVRITGGSANFAQDVTIHVTEVTGGNGIWIASNSSDRAGSATFKGDTTVSTAGAGMSAARIDTGILTFSGPATLTALDSNGTGLTVANGSAVFNGASNITGPANGVNVSGGSATFSAPATISSSRGDAVVVSGGTLDMSGGATISGIPAAAYAIHTLGIGAFNGSGLFDVTGNLRADGTSTLNLGMTGASVVTGTASYTTPQAMLNVSLSDTAVWNMTGSSSITGLTNDGGTIAFAAPAGDSFKALNVRNDYVGNNGLVELNTLLDAGGDLASQHTDRLLITGNASGTTLIDIKPTPTSTGAFTSTTGFIDASQGISVVQVAGTSTAAAFRLVGGYTTASDSPYQYRLYAYGPGSEHGVADPTQTLVGAGLTHWDYRLQGAYVTPVGPVDPDESNGGQPPNPDGGQPPNPDGGQPPNSGGGEEDVVVPSDARQAVAPQVAAYVTAPLAVLYGGFVDLDTLHRRLGELRDDRDLGRDGGPGEMFFRAYGGDFNYSSNVGFKNFGYNATGDYTAIQIGGNVYKMRDENGIWRFGLAGSLGWLHFEPEAIDGPSSSRSDTYRISGYGTYQSQRGWYVDTILSFGWFDGEVDTQGRGDTMKLRGSDYAASIETGYPFPVGWNINIEPQVQLVGQHVSFNNATDADDLPVNIGSQNQLIGRIGARVTRPFDVDKGRVTPYAAVDVLHAFVSGASVQVGDASFLTGKYGDALQFSLGANGSVSPKMSLYGRVSWQQSLGSAGFRAWLLNGGIRYLF